jgi:hypothetical protein
MMPAKKATKRHAVVDLSIAIATCAANTSNRQMEIK